MKVKELAEHMASDVLFTIMSEDGHVLGICDCFDAKAKDFEDMEIDNWFGYCFRPNVKIIVKK